jgi:histidyl-tRNA synthetase
LETALQCDQLDVFVVVAKEERRASALQHVHALRDAGLRVDYPLVPAKVGKQFQTAEQLGATVALLYGDEWPQVKVKTMSTREEQLVAHEDVLAHVARLSTLSSR